MEVAKLRAAQRKRLRPSQFASPKGQAPNKNKAQYPVDTRRRAANAKARATQMVKKGKLSPAKRDQIHAKANRVLRRKKK
jgi:hypothetical protein